MATSRPDPIVHKGNTHSILAMNSSSCKAVSLLSAWSVHTAVLRIPFRVDANGTSRVRSRFFVGMYVVILLMAYSLVFFNLCFCVLCSRAGIILSL